MKHILSLFRHEHYSDFIPYNFSILRRLALHKLECALHAIRLSFTKINLRKSTIANLPDNLIIPRRVLLREDGVIVYLLLELVFAGQHLIPNDVDRLCYASDDIHGVFLDLARFEEVMQILLILCWQPLKRDLFRDVQTVKDEVLRQRDRELWVATRRLMHLEALGELLEGWRRRLVDSWSCAGFGFGFTCTACSKYFIPYLLGHIAGFR